MTILHAYLRIKPCEVDLFSQVLTFEPNEQGHVVCDVPAGPALDRLLEITEAYRVYGAASLDEEDDEPLSRYVLTRNEADETVDLRTLDRAALLAFIAEQELEYKPHHKSADDTIRDKIVELLTEA